MPFLFLLLLTLTCLQQNWPQPIFAQSGEQHETDIRAILGLRLDETPDGIRIIGVTKDGLAERAGLTAGDIVFKLDGARVTNEASLSDVFLKRKATDRITVTYLREGSPHEIVATLERYRLIEMALGIVLSWGMMLALIVRVWLQTRAATRQISADPTQRSAVVRRFGKQRRQHLFALVAVQVAALYLFGWGWIGRALWPLPGLQVILLLPIITTLFISWMCFYEVDRLSNQLTAAADDPPYMARRAYVGLQARHNLLLVVPPLCLLLFQQLLFGIFPWLEKDSLFMPIFAIGM